MRIITVHIQNLIDGGWVYICNCNGLNERAIEATVSGGAKSVAEVYRRNSCAVRCGRCVPEICERLRRVRAARGVGIDVGASGSGQ